jgi:hypothetical protein
MASGASGPSRRATILGDEIAKHKGLSPLSAQPWPLRPMCLIEIASNISRLQDSAMSLSLILLILLVLLLAGGFSKRFGGYGYGYGRGCLGLIAILLIMLLVLLFGGPF